MNQNGIVTVVFGTKCDKLAAHTFLMSRKYTDLPILVLTNIKEDRYRLWSSVDNVTFKYYDLKDNENRIAKLQMIKHTIFEKSIYIDADSFVQSKEFDKLYDRIEYDSLLLNPLMIMTKNTKIPNIYMKTIKQFNLESPLNIYNGAFIGFMNTKKTQDFFDMWYKIWDEFGRNREMSCLAGAVQKTNINVICLNNGEYAPDTKNINALVQHNYYADFFKNIGISNVIELTKPKTDKTDFRMTIWE